MMIKSDSVIAPNLERGEGNFVFNTILERKKQRKNKPDFSLVNRKLVRKYVLGIIL